ncbi:MAG TPA: SGNH/GDSL hydrolase family protein [Gemmataceae bacterium]|nr:SGNH/GDSL hydrolase family protein [Gemmataceae bacterium]
MKRILLLSLFVSTGTTTSAAAFELRQGDRVVLLGNTLVEREQRHGYWETALTTRFPDRDVTFRNLGWSGDTVFGEARAGFGSPADGFRLLTEHVLALKPTVLLIAYGINEAFEGEAGLPQFVRGLNKLLDALAPAKARVVLISPLRHEDLGPPLPDPAKQNKNLQIYTDAIRKVAEKRGFDFVDLFRLTSERVKGEPLTDNGMHLTAYGYWKTAALLEQGLDWKPQRWRIDVGGKAGGGEGVELEGAPKGEQEVRFRATDTQLPAALSPKGDVLSGRERTLRIRELAPGKYVLKVDGKPVRTATAEEWQAGIVLKSGPEFDQVEKLRHTIIEKNRLYFHRWRPQNETYLFGFRQHEQGQNAREIPLFDPLVAAKEKEIARLRQPTSHRYQLDRVTDRPEEKR